MSVILVPQKGATSMTLLVLVKVGSRNETREINGASHFIEHLMFKGTKRRPTTQHISRELDRYGAEYNAYTDKDVGVFHILAGLERSRVKNAVRGIFDELKSVMRTGVTREELQRAKDHIRGRSMLAFENSANQAEWYGRQWLFQHQVETPEEKMKHWERVTAPDIRRVAQTLFRPAAMAAAVIGPFASAGTVRNMFVW